jgi:FkbM family methyltransferase
LEYLGYSPNFIVEVGTHNGDSAIALATKLPHSTIHTYEINPDFNNVAERFNEYPNIHFHNFGLYEEKGSYAYYKHIENDGANSLYLRYTDSMVYCGHRDCTTLKEEMERLEIESIDLLCMDVQGSELPILLGLGSRLTNIKQIILECPTGNRKELANHKVPNEFDSVYISAANRDEIIDFLQTSGFTIKKIFPENKIEDNILFTQDIMMI